jgi:hypothetical protein
VFPFAEYLDKSFTHIATSPHHPQSNGLAEKSMQIAWAKQMQTRWTPTSVSLNAESLQLTTSNHQPSY